MKAKVFNSLVFFLLPLLQLLFLLPVVITLLLCDEKNYEPLFMAKRKVRSINWKLLHNNCTLSDTIGFLSGFWLFARVMNCLHAGVFSSVSTLSLVHTAWVLLILSTLFTIELFRPTQVDFFSCHRYAICKIELENTETGIAFYSGSDFL